MKIILFLLFMTGFLYHLTKPFAMRIDSNMNENISTSIKNKLPVDLIINQQDADNWYAINDGVMGGLSEGKMVFNQYYGLFTGQLSLANNGGFSSVYRGIKNIPKDSETVVIDIKGDGQTYQLRLALNINGYRVAYKQEFETQRNVRQKITFSFADFRATYRGQLIQDAPVIQPEKIMEVGFLIANKKAGSFSLAVYNISF